MIYTLTLNPSIDYLLFLNEFDLHKTNRSMAEQKYPGGKGINVSRLLTHLNVDNCALGFIGGLTGKWILEQLDKEQIQSDFVKIKEETRTNVKIKIKTGEVKELEVNANGPIISAQEQAQLVQKLQQLTEADIVILSGNLSSSLPADFYQQLIQVIIGKKAQFVLDTSGSALKENLEFKPFLIKPNHEELEMIMQQKLTSTAEIIQAGKSLLNLGAQNVLISLGKDGALLLTQNAFFAAEAPKGELKNSVGAGDSMVAGFVASYQQTQDFKEALRFSIACGSATAFSEDIATEAEIMQLITQVKITEM